MRSDVKQGLYECLPSRSRLIRITSFHSFRIKNEWLVQQQYGRTREVCGNQLPTGTIVTPAGKSDIEFDLQADTIFVGIRRNQG